MRSLFLLAILSLVAFPAAAQGLFISDGFGVGVGFSSSDGIATIGGSAGYVLNGRFELGGEVARSEDEGLAVLELSPTVRFFPVRQASDMPVTVYVGAGYSFISFSGDEIDDLEQLGGDLSGNGYRVGGGLARSIEASPKLDVVLEGAFYYNSLTVEASFAGQSGSETESATSGSVAVNFAFGMASGGVFYLAPTLGFFDGEASFGVGAGIALGR